MNKIKEHQKIPSEINLGMKVLFLALGCMINGSALLLLGSVVFWWMAALALITDVFLGSIYFMTYYQFEKTYLYIRSGPFVEKIAYENIKSIRKVKNYASSMALSSQRIEIRQYDKSYILGTTMISPIQRDAFYAYLAQKCERCSS